MKKGSLALSTNAIVVMVIAFVVLSLALGLTKMVFNLGETGIQQAFDENVNLGKASATPSDPFTIKDFTLPLKTTKQLQIGYYNGDGEDHNDVKIGVKSCFDTTGNVAKNLFNVASGTKAVGATENVGFNIFITNVDKDGKVIMDAGKYVCEFIVYNGAETTTTIPNDKIYETKDVTITISG